MIKKIVSMLICVVIVAVAAAPLACAETDEYKANYYRYALGYENASKISVADNVDALGILDTETKCIAVEQNISKPIYQSGGTVMMMTAIIASQGLKATSEVKITSDMIVDAKNNSLSLKNGMSVKVNDLLAAVLYNADANCAAALAIATSGSVSDFVKAMNSTASKFGMKKTTYTSAWGEYSKEQVTTTEDLIVLVNDIINDTTLTDIAAEEKYYIKTKEIASTIKTISNPLEILNPKADEYESGTLGVGEFETYDNKTNYFIAVKNDKTTNIYALCQAKNVTYKRIKSIIEYTNNNFGLTDISYAVSELFANTSLSINNSKVSLEVKNTGWNNYETISSYLSQSAAKSMSNYSVKVPSDLPDDISVGDQIEGFKVYYDDIYVATISATVSAIGDSDDTNDSTEISLYKQNDYSEQESTLQKYKWLIYCAIVAVCGVAIIIIAGKIRNIKS